MAGEEGRDHHAEDKDCQGQDGEQERVEADEGIDGKEGESLSGLTPGKEFDDAVLQDKEDTDAGIEAAEVVGHEG